MQITDMQEIPAISKDTIALMERAVLEEQPDLVVYTGDQIKGYGVTYKEKGEELEREVAQTIGKLLEPVTKRGIPFAVTFGNHDSQVGISNQDQFCHIYKKLPNCIGEQAKGIDGGGTVPFPLRHPTEADGMFLNCICLTAERMPGRAAYEPFDPKIIAWYRKQREDLREKNGKYVPSIVFQHIPMREYYEVLKRVDRGEKGAVRAYRTHKNEYYKLGETCGAGDVFLEPPSVPDVNTGEFEALSECGEVLAAFVGHDHKNNFVGCYRNIALGFTPSAGFNVYGNRTKRGVRCIVLNEKKPYEYHTYTRTYEELVGKKVSRPVFDYLTSKAPATFEAAIPMILKAVLFLVLVIVLAVLLL